MFEEIMEILPLILPLLVIQLGLMVYCLLDLWKLNKNKRDKQDKWVWTLVVVLFSLLGALAYLVFERR
ncbi:MAG: PLD nuclease N-terminal domain-containing protein [Candidatus Bipolaricaulota bacterium]|nr:PLDc_N domain-containing protein [Candidatus Bipolaricaulota bacterium]